MTGRMEIYVAGHRAGSGAGQQEGQGTHRKAGKCFLEKQDISQTREEPLDSSVLY